MKAVVNLVKTKFDLEELKKQGANVVSLSDDSQPMELDADHVVSEEPPLEPKSNGEDVEMHEPSLEVTHGHQLQYSDIVQDLYRVPDEDR